MMRCSLKDVLPVLALALACVLPGHAATMTHAKTGLILTTPADWKPGQGGGLLLVASGRVTAPDAVVALLASATDLEGWEERERLAALDQHVIDESYRQPGRVRDIDRLGTVRVGKQSIQARHLVIVRDATSGPVRGRVTQDIYVFRRAHRKFTLLFLCPQAAHTRALVPIAKVLDSVDFKGY